jgi:DNA-binding MarR family transcriptional regulator
MIDRKPEPKHSASPCIAAATRAASRRLTQLYDEVMASTGLRVTQYHLLSELQRWAGDPPTVGELADLLTMDRSALGQTLRPLERDGFVAMTRDARDGRRRLIVLTPKGETAVEQARGHWARAHAAFETYFGEPAMADLRKTLRRIAEDPELALTFPTDPESSLSTSH